ncbi:MAG: hypothetical protein HND42_08360 [Armatimonadetes bacterium]|nr:hypothetical protein [Armatimonadota bacterium]
MNRRWVAWLFFLLTLAAAYAFFILPGQLGHRPMKIVFENPKEAPR